MPPWSDKFLNALRLSPNITEAARLAGIDRKTAYNWRDKLPEFAAAWEDAIEQATDALEAEARRRAYHGVDEPVFYQGVECGVIRKYSDTLMIVLLKAHRPQKFREQLHIEHAGTVELDWGSPSQDQDADAPSGTTAS